MSLLTPSETSYVLGWKMRQLEHSRYRGEAGEAPAHTYEKNRPRYEIEELRGWINEEREKAEALCDERLERLEELTATAESEAA